MDSTSILKILSSTRDVVVKHRQESRTKGEDFNVFYVMGMESNETKTHSNMLAALLHPKSNHYQGSTFLKLFLEEINYDFNEEELDNVEVITEYHLGKISKDYMNGGYIDLLIKFPGGRIITIENKIYAPDQKKQLYRYKQFHKDSNTLFYLNLFGHSPSKHSVYKLEDHDYEILTYRDHIIDWLEKCLITVQTGSIIETSIRQYLILLQKLTHTMDNQLENQLNQVIFENLEEAKYIHANYEKAILKVKDRFQNAVYNSLKEKLNSDFKIHLDNDTSFVYSQIWIDIVLNDKPYRFGIESFSGKGNNKGRLYVGIFGQNLEIASLESGDSRLNSYWPVYRTIITASGNPLNLSSSNILSQLHTDQDYFDTMVQTVTKQVITFLKDYSALK